MSRRILVTLLLAGSLPFTAAETAAGKPWRLVSADKFAGTKLDRTKWRPYNGVGNQGYGVRRPAQIRVVDGKLVITARMIDGVLHSGGLSHRTNLRYGRFAFRVRTEADPSAATSAAVLTWPKSGNQLRDGANDIYETGVYSDRSPFYSFVHFGTKQYNVVHHAKGTKWHTMAMEWKPGVIRIYRDGRRIRTMGPAGIPTSRHHLSIQLDALKDSMNGVVRMYVAWVRIYRRARAD